MGNLTITTKVLEKIFDLTSLFGMWKDDKSSKKIISDIRNSRVEPKDSKQF